MQTLKENVEHSKIFKTHMLVNFINLKGEVLFQFMHIHLRKNNFKIHDDLSQHFCKFLYQFEK